MPVRDAQRVRPELARDRARQAAARDAVVGRCARRVAAAGARPARRATSTTWRRCASARVRWRPRPRSTAASTRSRPIRIRRSCARSSTKASAWNACRRASSSMCSRRCPSCRRSACCSRRASRRAASTKPRSRAASPSPSTTSRRCSAGRRCSAAARSGCASTSATARATTRRSAPAASRPSSACRSRASMPSSREARKLGVRISGLHAHLGSGIDDPRHWRGVYADLAGLADNVGTVETIDIGGGLPIPYTPDAQEFDLAQWRAGLDEIKAAYPRYGLVIEPGRYLVAEAGVLLLTVDPGGREGRRAPRRRRRRHERADAPGDVRGLPRHPQPEPARRRRRPSTFDVVGPICETGDVLGRGRAAAAWPPPRATCCWSPTPAPTAWRWPTPTTCGRCRQRTCLKKA